MKNISIHHAYCIIGDASLILSDLFKIVYHQFGATSLQNPDFIHRKFETLTIDDSRALIELHTTKPFSATIPRIFIIEMYGATREAQNALLKILEEPEPGNYFFIIIPSVEILLPTLRSRLSILDIRLDSTSTKSTLNDAESFIRKSLKERIEYVDALASGISEEKVAKHEAVSFLNNLEEALHKKGPIASQRKIFEAIALSRTFLGDRAPSIKMLLEYVALSI
jgi:DNA polymerase III delta prime subunit